MKNLVERLDAVASAAEKKGLKKLAAEIDVVSNTLESKFNDIAIKLRQDVMRDPRHAAEELFNVNIGDDDEEARKVYTHLLKDPKIKDLVKKDLFTSSSVVLDYLSPITQKSIPASVWLFLIEDGDHFKTTSVKDPTLREKIYEVLYTSHYQSNTSEEGKQQAMGSLLSYLRQYSDIYDIEA
jgi:hypothetical protein